MIKKPTIHPTEIFTLACCAYIGVHCYTGRYPGIDQALRSTASTTSWIDMEGACHVRSEGLLDLTLETYDELEDGAKALKRLRKKCPPRSGVKQK